MSSPSTSTEAPSSTADTLFDLVESHGSTLAMAMLWLFPLVALLLGLTRL